STLPGCPSSCPPGNEVNKATLRLFVSHVKHPGTFSVVGIGPSTVPWTEGTITNNNSALTAPPYLLETTSAPMAQYQFINIDITNLVKDWLNGLFPITVWLLCLMDRASTPSLTAKRAEPRLMSPYWKSTWWVVVGDLLGLLVPPVLQAPPAQPEQREPPGPQDQQAQREQRDRPGRPGQQVRPEQQARQALQ